MTTYKTNDAVFVKDGSSGAVLNTDAAGYRAYKSQRDSQRQVNTLYADVDKLKADMSEIRSLLQLIVERIK